MSARLVGFVLDHGPTSSVAKLILVTLADRADEKGKCWPGREDIMRRASITKPTYHRHMEALERDGWIIREERPGRSNLYHLNVQRLWEAERGALDIALGGKKVDPPAEGGKKMDPRGAKSGPPGGKAAYPEPSLNQERTSRERASAPEGARGPLTDETRAVLSEFLNRDGIRRRAHG